MNHFAVFTVDGVKYDVNVMKCKSDGYGQLRAHT